MRCGVVVVVVLYLCVTLLVCWAPGNNTVDQGKGGYIDKARQGSDDGDNSP